jgi:NADH-quinone oxidoreductase subunit E
MTAELARINEIIDRYPPQRTVLIQLLLDIQGQFNWVSGEAVRCVSERLGVPLSQIYRVASFYKAMSLEPRGRHIVSVCMGTACHVRGAPRVAEKVGEVLGVGTGGTTDDKRFTVERVNCLGCCALGPVMLVDKDYHGKMTPAKIEGILKDYT